MRVLQDYVTAEDEMKSNGIFEMEEEPERPKSTTQHSRTVSWCSEPDEIEVPIIDENNESDSDNVASSSPSTSSSMLSTGMAASQGSSPMTMSAPSSYSGSPVITQKPRGAEPIPIANSSGLLSSIAEHNTDRTLVGAKVIVSESPPIQRSANNFKPSISPGASRVWNKIKSSVGRPSTADDSVARKDKGRINGMLSSASKGLLSRGSSWSLSSSECDDIRNTSMCLTLLQIRITTSDPSCLHLHVMTARSTDNLVNRQSS